MTAEHDDVVLTQREQRALVELEAVLAAVDPDLNRRLGRGQTGRIRGRLAAGLVLLILGATVMMTAMARGLWLATAGAALIAGGLAIVFPMLVRASSRRCRDGEQI